MLEALEDLAQQLTAAGIPADIDPARVPVPGAWVAAEEMQVVTLDGTQQLHVDVHLIVPDNGTRAALEQLQTMLATALSVIDPRAAVTLDATVKTPGGVLPAFTIPTVIYC